MNKQKIVASIIVAGGLVSPLAYATNGDTMLAVGSQNTALGGTGVANFVGAESAFPNPAMLGKSKGKEVTGGIVLFKPSVTNTGFTATTAANSTADTSYIPDISYSDRLSGNLTYGIAMAAAAGMGVNYTDASAQYVKAKTTLSILKVVPTVAYNEDNFGLGFSPVIQYGSLAISYDTTAFGGGPHNASHNADSHSAIGYTLGAYFNAMPALTLAASYNSSIKMSYGQQLSSAGLGFGQTFADKLDQPAEMKAGIAYVMADSFTVTADYRLIQWASAAGYKEFGWKDQTVISLGGKYAANDYWVGVGYNNSDDPISVYANGTLTPAGNNGGVVNMFNNLMFPAIIKSAYTFGGGYNISKELGVEGSVMIAPEVKKTVDISDAAGAPPGSLSNTTTHSQKAYSVSLRYKF
jgi:long-chain fatty acid transport protein